MRTVSRASSCTATGGEASAGRAGEWYNCPMRTQSRTAGAALLIALAACGGERAAGDAIVVRDSSGVAIVENDLLRLDAACTVDATPSVSIGVEEGGEEYELESVTGARRLSDGRVVVALARDHQLRWYGADGMYIRASGRQGEGPGEFRQPFTLHRARGDTIFAGDIRPFRLLVFTPDGDWVRTIDAKPMMINSPNAIGLLDDGRMMLVVTDLGYFGAPVGQFVQGSRTVQLHAADGTTLDTVANLPHGRIGKLLEKSSFNTMPMFESYSHSAAADSFIVLGHGAERELRVHATGDGTPLVRLIRWNGPSRQVTEGDIEAERERERRTLEKAPANLRPMFEEAYETNTSRDRPIADVMPAMNAIRLGADGRIWIREYKPPVDTTPANWIAFTREGRFDCRLTALPRSSEQEFGADYLLVLERDSLDVERVKQYPISRP